MSAEPQAMAPPAVVPPARYPWTRLYAWSVRREIWENRSVYLAPIAVAGVSLVGVLLSLFSLHRRMSALAAGNMKVVNGLIGPFSFTAAAILLTGLLVSFFYCVGALHGERRDRTILFWKSLPVSDRVTVLAKFTVPFAIVPAVTLLVTYATQLITLAVTSLAIVIQGFDPAPYWAHAGLPLMWTMLPYGLFVMALWQAPLMGWLLLVSAWAKRTPILWAVVPPAAPAIIEPIALGSHHVWDFIANRLLGGGVVWTVHGDGKHPVERFDQISFQVFAGPDIWVGLAFAALFLGTAIWLRRRREPV